MLRSPTWAKWSSDALSSLKAQLLSALLRRPRTPPFNAPCKGLFAIAIPFSYCCSVDLQNTHANAVAVRMHIIHV